MPDGTSPRHGASEWAVPRKEAAMARNRSNNRNNNRKHDADASFRGDEQAS
jgi:hypothetical protein